MERKYGKNLVLYKSRLKLTAKQKDVRIGTLLGDAYMGWRLKKPLYSIKFEQKVQNKDYINHLYEIFKPFVGTEPKIRINKKTEKQSIWFRTYRHDLFIFYFELFYTQKAENSNCSLLVKTKTQKFVPLDIQNYLNNRALAYWFMDDGSYDVDHKTKKKAYVFNTQGFSKVETDFLCEALRTKFNFVCTSTKDGNYWRIRISTKDSAKFRKIVKPYILPTFKYKLF